MKLFGKLAGVGTTVVIASVSAGCLSAPAPPVATATAPASPTSPATSASRTQPGSITPTEASVTLPREADPVTILGISGTHVLVQGYDRYRISHDSGRTWAIAEFPCANADGCDPSSASIGRVADGVVINESSHAGRLDAYSLVTNAGVGTSYAVPPSERVVDKTGGRVLLADAVTSATTVRSLLDGTVRDVAVPTGSAVQKLLADGSVLASTSGTGTSWQRIAPDGATTTVATFERGTGEVLVSGDVALFRISYPAAPRYCVVDVLTAARSCQPGSDRDEQLYALSDKGLLVTRYRNGVTQLLWLALADGALAKPKLVGTLEAWNFEQAYGVEDATPMVATWTDSTTSLWRPEGTGVTRLALDWATRPVFPDSLALGSATVVGTVETHSTKLTWARPLDAKGIGTQKRLGAAGRIAASGSRIALAEGDTGRIRFFNAGRLVGTAGQPEATGGYTFSGAHLLARPACRSAVPAEDDDCEQRATLYTATGKIVKTPRFTEDISGEFQVVRGGDGSISSRTLEVSNFVRPGEPSFTVQLPDAGAGGTYTDVRLWGDWIGATQHLADGTMHPVVVNFRTARVLVSVDNAQLRNLGDGIAVGAQADPKMLVVWRFTTGATLQLAASSTAVAVDGTRVAYTRSNSLVVADFAG